MSKSRQKNKLNLLKLKTKNIPASVVVFVILSIIFGSVYIKNIGSFSGPDMYRAHYRASLALATSQSFSNPTQKKFGRINYIVGQEKYFNSGKKCTNSTIVTSLLVDPLKPDGLSGCTDNYDSKLSNNNVKVEAVLQYPPLSYLPQAVGLWAGMKLNMAPVKAQILARYINLFVYICFIAVSIYIAPKGKWLIAFLGLLPTSLFLASSLSADGLNIAWSILFVSYSLHIYTQKNRITRKQIAAIFLLGVGMFLLKVAYSPVVLILLALKPATIKTRTKWLLFLAICLVGLSLYAIWSSNWSSLSARVDIHEQTNLIFSNLPKVMTGILVNILFLPHMLFKQSASYVVPGMVIVYIMYEQMKSKTIQRTLPLKTVLQEYKLQILGIAAAIISLVMTLAALLLTWTDVTMYGWLNIQGFQGRYIIPLMPLILLVYYLPEKKKGKA